jgi:hypothetical protein
MYLAFDLIRYGKYTVDGAISVPTVGCDDLEHSHGLTPCSTVNFLQGSKGILN